jgi:AAA+ superfamily predicted ATPase
MDVVVVATAQDIQAETIARTILGRGDMALAAGRVLTLDEADLLLRSSMPQRPLAILLVGPDHETQEPAERFLTNHENVVVMCLAAPRGDVVRLSTRHHLGLEEMFATLHALVDSAPAAGRLMRSVVVIDRSDTGMAEAREWIHEVFRAAIERLPKGHGEILGFSTTAQAVLETLDTAAHDESASADDRLTKLDDLLTSVLASDQHAGEPWVVLSRTFNLSLLELKLMLLAIAPELDARYQRCVGVLMDDLSRRVGSLGLYAGLLGEPAEIRHELGRLANLSRWRVVESTGGAPPAADEPFRLDASLVSWIFGDHGALTRDPHLRSAIRPSPWPGARLLGGKAELGRAAQVFEYLERGAGSFALLAGSEAAWWRASVELGAEARVRSLIRVEAARFSKLDLIAIEECGLRLGRASLISGNPLIIDVADMVASADVETAVSSLLGAVHGTGCAAAVICDDAVRISRLLGTIPFTVVDPISTSSAARAAAFENAARIAGATLEREESRSLASLHPLQIDGLEQAASVAAGRKLAEQGEVAAREGFIAACKQASADGLSNLAERMEPMFSLDDVVLPEERKKQLFEIVDNLRYATRVLDDWKFGAQLPYGRGVTALLHGPSGTGKTMAALAVAKELGVQVLRIDLSRIVSKYIGETEKNIERVFDDARRSGAALLMDEAEALLGKRSEVKDAHDRYANIEVAYLLQRMEAYDGLAILTTNLLQNVDAAFVRRLRFIIDFPRPDAAAREIIWRQCLPEGSHEVDAAAFRLLARKIDLTGGHIRQITVRAAFVAAAADSQIGLQHILYATNAELAKVGQQPVTLDQPASRRVA